MDWQYLRTMLAVGQHQSLKRAGQALGVDPTTVSRRISALEEELGSTLFVRARKRWRLTSAGHAVLARCERMAEEIRAMRHDVDQAASQVKGRVRITALDTMISHWLVPQLPTLREAHPGLELEFLVTGEIVDLVGGKADIALRLNRPTQAGLLIKHLRDIPLVVAGRPEVASLPVEERPVILIGFLDLDNAENRAIRAQGGPVVYAATSFSVLVSMIQEGLGIGMLPRELAEEEGFVLLDEEASLRRLWRAVPAEIAHAPRIRAILNWLDEFFGEMS